MSLIERLEAASGPNFALEVEIAQAVSFDFHEEFGGVISRPPPNYTASVDAALTLVPEDMRDEIEITTLYQVARVAINLNHGPDSSPFYGSHEGNSIPLALCIAALKARGIQ